MIKKILGSILLSIFMANCFAVNPDDLLHPDEAFKVSLSSVSAKRIKATWKIADDYYMYRKRFSFKSDTPGVTFGEAVIPKGKIKDDPGFGRVEIYRNQVAIEIPVIRDSTARVATELSVKTVSQGCADAGVCYPPQKQTVTIQLAALEGAKAVKETAAGSVNLFDELGISALVNSNPPLHPDEAFSFEIRATDHQNLKAKWKITEGHYLYQDKIKLKLLQPTGGLALGEFTLPKGKKEHDKFFGDIVIYNKDFSTNIPLLGTQKNSSTKLVKVKASYQGCSKLTGICYPPQHKTLTVNLISSPALKINAVSTKPTVPAMELAPLSSKPKFFEQNNNNNDFIPKSSLAPSDPGTQFSVQGLGTGITPLHPDEAFGFDISVINKQNLNLRWNVTKGHYLYQDKLKFALVEPSNGVSLGVINLPKGKAEHDEYFGDIVIYNEDFNLKVPLIGIADAVTIKVTYQGCSKLTGICYPPQDKTQTINLAAAQALAVTSDGSDNLNTNAVAETVSKSVSATATSVQSKVSEQDSFVNKLLTGNFLAVLFTFFVAGIALTFTPCVFPMIPILSGIIAGQGTDNSTRKSFFLSLSYVLAMALTYAIAGVIAALSGENLQAALQNPWVIGAFAGLFVLLSLAMFGFYELQMPASIQSKLTSLSNSQTGGSMMNAGIMGFLSALIVGPCVTAPLIGALIYIAQTKDVVLGGLSLFTLGLGMGVPLLIIGTSAGKILPKAGAWMDKVKAGFGIMMLALAIWMLERILPFEVIVLLVGILALFTGIYMGGLDSLSEASSGWKRFFKASGLLVLAYAVMLLIGVATGSGSLIHPLKGSFGSGTTQAVEQKLVFQQIKGVDGLNQALKLAKQQNQTVMLDFYADWCISCKEMEHNTFTDSDVIESLKNTVLLQADVTLNDKQDDALLKEYGLFGPPGILFFDKNSQENLPYRVVGYMKAKTFNNHIKQFNQTIK